MAKRKSKQRFNGAALRKAERGPGGLPMMPAINLLQWGRLEEGGKGRSGLSGAGSRRGFNGAALRKAERGLTVVPTVVRKTMLQWGRLEEGGKGSVSLFLFRDHAPWLQWGRLEEGGKGLEPGPWGVGIAIASMGPP